MAFFPSKTATQNFIKVITNTGIPVLLLTGYAFGQDTLQTKTDSLHVPSAISKNDSATTAAIKNPADTTSSSGKVQSPAVKQAEDTASLFLKTPYFNFGIGWALGSYDLLSEWQKNLPDSANDILPVNPDTLGFSIKEPVNTYNVLFPVSLSYTPFVYSRSSVGFEGSFFYIGKTLQAELMHDTASGKIDYSQTMNAFSFSLGVLYRHAIDEKYFRLENVDRTSFLLGVYAQPLVYISRESSIKHSGISDSVVAAAEGRIKNLYARGLGAAWRIGICSQKALSRTSGMEISISYVGRYTGYFSQGNRTLSNKDINPAAANLDEKLSFFSNTIEIRLEFLIGQKPHLKK
jgi:hypothetical protein